MTVQNNAKIRIVSTQTGPDGQTSVTRSGAEGVIREKNGILFLLYSEKDEDEAVTKSVVRLSPDSAVITRSGLVSTRFTFSEQQPCRTTYTSPYGSFPVDIDTRRYVLERSNVHTCMKISYSLSFGGGEAGSVRLEMEIDHEAI